MKNKYMASVAALICFLLVGSISSSANAAYQIIDIPLLDNEMPSNAYRHLTGQEALDMAKEERGRYNKVLKTNLSKKIDILVSEVDKAIKKSLGNHDLDVDLQKYCEIVLYYYEKFINLYQADNLDKERKARFEKSFKTDYIDADLMPVYKCDPDILLEAYLRLKSHVTFIKKKTSDL